MIKQAKVFRRRVVKGGGGFFVFFFIYSRKRERQVRAFLISGGEKKLAKSDHGAVKAAKVDLLPHFLGAL